MQLHTLYLNFVLAIESKQEGIAICLRSFFQIRNIYDLDIGCGQFTQELLPSFQRICAGKLRSLLVITGQQAFPGVTTLC